MNKPKEQDPLFYIQIVIGNLKFDALVDTGSLTNALPMRIFNQIADSIVSKNSPPTTEIYTATGQKERCLFSTEIPFRVGLQEFKSKFLVIQRLNTPILGAPFLSENNLMVDMKQKLLLTPDLTFIINEIQQTDGKISVRHEEQTFNIYTKTKTTLGPCKQDLVICLCASKTFELANIIGIIEPFDFFEQNSGVFVTSSLNRVDDKNQLQISFLNTSSHEATIPAGTKVAVFTVLTPKQANFITPIDPQIAALIQTNPNSSDENKLAPIEGKKYADAFWFKTPESCENPEFLTGIEKRIYDEILECKRQAAKNPLNNEANRTEFLSQFSWKDSVLSKPARKSVEKLLVSYHHIFGKHRFDVGLASNFSVRLKPEHDRPVYSACP